MERGLTLHSLDSRDQDALDPTIPIAGFPPVDSIIWMESVGITHAPLTPGTHFFALHAANTQPAFGGFFSEYSNTWTVTVEL